MIKTTQQNNKRAAFTLVEVMIVVVILGILAATVLPQFISTNDDAKESVLVQDLQTLRSQIQLFKFQHTENILQTDLQMQMIFVMRYCFPATKMAQRVLLVRKHSDLTSLAVCLPTHSLVVGES